MKSATLHFLGVILIGLSVSAHGENQLSIRESAEVRLRLEEFDQGKCTLEDITQIDDEDWVKKLLTFYASHKEEITPKMKIAISRGYAVFGKLPVAAELAQQYINVYSNDCRGWDILAGIKIQSDHYEDGLAAATNAIRLGCDRNIIGTAGVALHLERMDVLENLIVPRLLVLKNEKQLREKRKLQMIQLLLMYSLKSNKEDVFVKTLEGVKPSEIAADEIIKCNVHIACQLFKGKEVEKICGELAEKPGGNINTNLLNKAK